MDYVIDYYRMKKEDLEKELQAVLKEAEELEERLKLELETVYFLGKESDKLILKWNDPTLSYDQREKVGQQMAALQKRLEHESKAREKDTPRIIALDNKFNQLLTMVGTLEP